MIILLTIILIIVDNFVSNLVSLFLYMSIYNISMISIFWLILNLLIIKKKTIFSFIYLKFNFFYNFMLLVTLLSIAGVPPFIGFFSKLLILLILTSSNFFILYFFFFILLFQGLYFYLQNLKFLNSNTNLSSNFQYLNQQKNSIFFLYFIIIFLYFSIVGFLFLDDLFLYFFWFFL